MSSGSEAAYLFQVLRWLLRTAVVAFLAGSVTFLSAFVFGFSMGVALHALAVTALVVTLAWRTFPVQVGQTVTRRI
jgi:ribose/xylose/arabinose/galactoside ABC-type transport system permease subunit